jgi:hypothetical protein|tara:strand:+ start:312 stop:461 length:150 start_codon:yes stop_codon:yes gene_type:complete
MWFKRKNTALTVKKKKLRLQVFVGILFFIAFKAIFTDWEHFKVGLTGDF